ncbi:MAG TPA: type IV pilus twitching motility protein PilT [Candidatus Polarisedimenticolaceae bacterium]|nr:type IV pilus twitching motility protein PilT [Candidatus Polarisedimenticolaceae bacterium]
MAQLDTWIGAMAKYSGQALELFAGNQPVMIIGGERRPVGNAPLEAVRVAKLLAEIAPAEEQPAVAAGRAATFRYSTQGVVVVVDIEPGPRATLRRAAERAPVPAATATDMLGLLRQLVALSGSDLHLTSGSVPTARIHGTITPLPGLGALPAESVQRLLYEIAPERHRRQFESRGDADFAYEIEGLARFRCNLFRDRTGPGGVFRVIPVEIRSAADLGLSKEIQDLCFLTRGLVLVTGPTGSGKSTTLAALVDLVNARRQDHIITIEDPIEFIHKSRTCIVNQREVGEHTESFKSALRAALREDPDVVLVGEMRDLETVSIALETAETGHLVFGTLHTSSAVSTVDRLVDQFPPDQQSQVRVMLSESLKAVIAQVLCRKLSGGRAAALEVLMVTPAVANLIREGKTFQIPSLMQTGRKLGMITMTDALVDLVTRKVIDPAEAYLRSSDKAALLAAFTARGIAVQLPGVQTSAT